MPRTDLAIVREALVIAQDAAQWAAEYIGAAPAAETAMRLDDVIAALDGRDVRLTVAHADAVAELADDLADFDRDVAPHVARYADELRASITP